MKVLIAVAVCVLLNATASSAAVITYIVSLSGPNESPPTTSTGTGSGTVTIDDVTNMLTVNFSFTGLTSGTTAAHIHCCTAAPFSGIANVATPVPAFPNFTPGVTSGTYSMSFNMMLSSSWNPAFVTASGGVAQAEAAFIAAAATGETYLNVHTTQNTGGEIRGFLVAAPEPGTWALAGAALVWLGTRRRRRS